MSKLSTQEWRAPVQPIALQLLRQSPDLTSERHAALLATVHERLVPALVTAHWTEARAFEDCAEGRAPPTESEVADLARLALNQDMPGALAFVESLLKRGLSLEVTLLHLISPAARLLGEQWQTDETSWAEVTVGLGTLQQLVHVFGPAFALGAAHRGLVVLVATPHEQHTLGLYVLGEFFRRDGWNLLVEPGMSDDELLNLVGSDHVDMVGVSIGSAELIEPAGRRIAAVKRASRNRHIAIMVGGALDLSSAAASFGATFFGNPRDAVAWLNARAQVGCAGGG